MFICFEVSITKLSNRPQHFSVQIEFDKSAVTAYPGPKMQKCNAILLGMLFDVHANVTLPSFSFSKKYLFSLEHFLFIAYEQQRHFGEGPSREAAFLFRFMELDKEILNEEPFKRCRIMSVPDYVQTLCIPGNFVWRRAIHTILVHFKLNLLLPVADLFVNNRKEGKSGDDTFSPIAGAALLIVWLFVFMR
jgi:hypothetical protein